MAGEWDRPRRARPRQSTSWQRLDVPEPARRERRARRASVLRVDRFGNLVTNIDRGTPRAGLRSTGRSASRPRGNGSSRRRRDVRRRGAGLGLRARSAAATASRSRSTAAAPQNASGLARGSAAVVTYDSTFSHDEPGPDRRAAAARAVRPRVGARATSHRASASSIARTGSIRGILPQMAELGLLGVSRAAGVRRRRDGLRQPRPRERGARIRRHVAARDHVGARRAELPDAARRGAPRTRSSGISCRRRRARRSRPTGSPSRRPAATRAAFRRSRSRRAIATCSRARRCGSRSPTSPTTSSCSPGRDLEKKKQRDPSGISAFIVERAFKGFSSGTLKEKWGILAGNTGFFKMDDVEVPAENLRRAARAKGSRSRCSRSTRDATPWPPARPA